MCVKGLDVFPLTFHAKVPQIESVCVSLLMSSSTLQFVLEHLVMYIIEL